MNEPGLKLFPVMDAES